ncbi:hypothetical protein KC614_02120 [candidate division WWE3 bacterium]|uniref:Dipeptidylpeptidase IV N-terminal domain-containing protein n=1 Tax=candidate division WWE3 bacterium TaxID=2053526 RepID=A0A955RRZ8_UNCKA|nr:hypothetical protein [candidate division WWE3 bacterium]
MNRKHRLLKATGLIVLILIVIIVLRNAKNKSCADGSCTLADVPACEENCVKDSESPSKLVQSLIQISDDGGRVDWYKGESHETIAFDAVVDNLTKDTAVFTMNPDGNERVCVSCDTEIPEGFVGQPAWHPDGRHLIVQAESSYSGHTVTEHVSFGLNNDLWIIDTQTKAATRIWKTDLNHAALHPHFSPDGTKLIFAERIPTGIRLPIFGNITPGGENHWAGWQIRIADFDISNLTITSSFAVKPNGSGLYETNEFSTNDIFTYSFTRGGATYVNDIYKYDLAKHQSTQLISSSGVWDEHGIFRPDDSGDLTYISSQADANWQYPGKTAADLSTELFIKRPNGDNIQLTEFNKDLSSPKRYIVSDYSWNKDGTQLAVQVAPKDKRTNAADKPQIWLMTFNIASET